MIHRNVHLKRGHLQAADLGHNREECDSTYKGALPTHVATSDDLESRLLGSINIVGDKFRLHDVLLNRMPSVFQAKSVANARSNCATLMVYFKVREVQTIVMNCYEVCKGRQLELLSAIASIDEVGSWYHVQHRYSFANLEQD